MAASQRVGFFGRALVFPAAASDVFGAGMIGADTLNKRKPALTAEEIENAVAEAMKQVIPAVGKAVEEAVGVTMEKGLGEPFEKAVVDAVKKAIRNVGVSEAVEKADQVVVKEV